MPAPPNPHWHEDNPVLSLRVPAELMDEIRAAMRRDGAPYASPYIRKLLRHGLWVMGREVGE